MVMGIIYKATNLTNNKIYIGQTVKSLIRRKQLHISDAERGSELYFHRALRKNKDIFQWETIEECENCFLNEREIYWISEYKSNNQNTGYNLTSGGVGGNIIDFLPNKKEIALKRINKIKEFHKHNKKPKKHLLTIWTEWYGAEIATKKYEEFKISKGKAISEAKKGKTYSDQHRKAISDSLKGKKVPKEVLEKRMGPRPYRQKQFPKEVYKLICELYTVKNFSLKAIERELEINRMIIKRILTENNIEIRQRKNQHQ